MAEWDKKCWRKLSYFSFDFGFSTGRSSGLRFGDKKNNNRLQILRAAPLLEKVGDEGCRLGDKGCKSKCGKIETDFMVELFVPTHS